MKDSKKNLRPNTETKFHSYIEAHFNMKDIRKQEIIQNAQPCFTSKRIFIKMNNEIICEILFSPDNTCEWLIKEVN